jgi:hypothetical protein
MSHHQTTQASEGRTVWIVKKAVTTMGKNDNKNRNKRPCPRVWAGDGIYGITLEWSRGLCNPNIAIITICTSSIITISTRTIENGVHTLLHPSFVLVYESITILTRDDMLSPS